MHSLEFYRSEFISYQQEKMVAIEPRNLYEPITYLLDLGGKRIRPVLTLMTSEIFGGDYKGALDAALAVEIFHNFSLVHDDIMDDAPTRRGKSTVHEKWNINTGILSGDVMLIKAYQVLECYEGQLFKDLIHLFSKTAVAVCEGQQYDVDFENREDVALWEYLKMIEFKTAVLLAAAMKMGAMIAGAESNALETIYQFGKNLGIAFQLQDDYLDAFGDPKTFGKQIGGDIIENKKTFLYLQALELANSRQRLELEHLFSIKIKDNEDKIATVKDIFLTSGAAESTKIEIKRYTEKAFELLKDLEISEEHRNILITFGQSLIQREV